MDEILMLGVVKQLRNSTLYIFSRYLSIRNYLEDKISDRTNLSVFSDIYKYKKWGGEREPHLCFYSGPGSHDPVIVEEYAIAIERFVRRFPQKIDVVDLGCGDFNVGARIRHQFAKYIACDVVPDLIDYNQSKFIELNVEFKCLDLTIDAIPSGDVVVIRQVLQHLSNRKIMKFISSINKFKFAIITEHVPNGDFISNLDTKTNGGIRLDIGSGVVLTDPPFNLRVKTSEILCEVQQFGGVIRTIAYEL